MRTRGLFVTLALLAPVGCGGGQGDGPRPDAELPDASPPPDAPAEVPMISDVLTCGVAGTAGGLSDGTELQRHDYDLNAFPDALCNDGTTAVMYYRPFSGAANEQRWVIQLQGGGGCSREQSCADRWCQVGTNFSMTGMTSSVAPEAAIDGNGILERRADNPVGDWNHVFLRYCSSDTWSGTARDVIVDAEEPVMGGAVQFRMHFLGSRILDAALGTLRQQGVPALTYTLDGGAVPMPDLDEAEQVLVAGASAGGGGVVWNVDRIVADLEGVNPGVLIRALIDSAFAPSLETLDYSLADVCLAPELMSCDWPSYVMADAGTSLALWQPVWDRSCYDWHQANLPGTDWQCGDQSHVTRHHVTTPMFVRMSQHDSLISGNFRDGGFSVDGTAAMTLDEFATLVRVQLEDLADIQATAHEGADITVVPGAFGPTCPKHETLRSTPDVFNATIRDGADDLAMFDVILNWLMLSPPSILVTQPGGIESCPPP
jgi:hypothetical protein